MTDPRLAEAQERAASVAAAWGDFDPTKRQYLEGWAETVERLTTVEDGVDEDGYIRHLGNCYLGNCDKCDTIDGFIVAMLGERDG